MIIQYKYLENVAQKININIDNFSYILYNQYTHFKEGVSMICSTTKELLAEIKKYMSINDIQTKDLAINLGKSQQSVSQYFKNGNPRCDSIFKICDALNVDMDISFKRRNG